MVAGTYSDISPADITAGGIHGVIGPGPVHLLAVLGRVYN